MCVDLSKARITKKSVTNLIKKRIAEEEKYDGFYAIATNVEGESG